MSTFDLDLDVDELRCRLLEETNEALAVADELVFAIETTASIADARVAAANFRQIRARMRTLRSLIRVEEGRR